jgi:SAM-dependent methyltransferase
MAAELVRPTDRLLADVGCGGAGMAAALASTAAPDAEVVAVDGNEEILAAARENLAGAGIASRVRLARADLTGGQAGLAAVLSGAADLIWASAVVHHAGDQQATVDTLTGLLAPGGRLALAEGGLRARHFPWDLGVGSPGLELRFEAAHDRWFASMRTELPGSVPMPYGWTTALRRGGLTDVTTRTTMIERPPPLGADDTAFVVDRLSHWVDRLREVDLLDPDDLDAWKRLLDTDDPAWLGRRDDLFVLEAHSVHTGVRPPAQS